MTSSSAWALILGITLGLGLWSMIAVAPRLNRPRLSARVAPYLLDISDEARIVTRRTTSHPLPFIGWIFQPLLDVAKILTFRLTSGNHSVRIRLRQAGSRVTVDEFRSSQLIWLTIGFGCGCVLAIIGGSLGSTPLLTTLALPFITATIAFVIKDWLLTRAAAARLRRIAAEFPTIAEFLTLSLSAGEGILDALRRVSAVSSGELAHELATAVAAVRTGTPLASALHDLAQSVRLPIVTRCIDAIVGALERGTPLAEVIRAHASDARTESKRELIEAAGKKEVAMLVPLVFMILPVTVLFAIFPGIAVLQTGF